MLIPLQHLVDRARHPKSRADELARLRARHSCQPSRREASDRATALAKRLRELRREMSVALAHADIQSCRGCAKGHPLPEGRWQGGHCCGGNTLTIFNAEEVAALKLGGTSPRHWRPPRDEHAGCAFRGATGCSLEPEHRPSICLRYLCIELRGELKPSEHWSEISRLGAELRDVFEKLKRELLAAT